MADIIETLEKEGLYETFLDALALTGLTELLKESGPFTVFAPDESAFAKLSPNVVEELLSDPDRLKNILLYHILQDEYMFDDLEDNPFVETMQGESVGLDFSRGVSVNAAAIMEMDIEADNGIIHSIDTVLLPKTEARVYG